jgi:hypothetical protein
MKRIIISGILLSLFFVNPVSANDRAPLRPVKVSSPPVIDGILDEEIWKKEPDVSGFKTFNPDYGKEMPFNTVVWLAYDEENLYYAFKCYDPEPDKIKVSVDARDKIRPDDWVCVNLDSFNDQQTLYCIYANANGIQMDTRFAAGNEDLGMDLVFYSAGSIDSEGYCVEIRLPLKSIRFSNREPVMMAATFERHIARIYTNGTFPPLDADQAMAFLTQMQPVRYDGLKHYTLFEILPAITYSYKAQQDEGKMSTTENKPDAGLTLKYGITSQMILDATINPDYSQIEADAGQVDVNLRYQLFYPEKRPFFQEGNENFQVGSTGSSALDPVYTFVHTRNIANPLTGVKLSGKAGMKNSIAVLYSTDRTEDSEIDTYGKYSHYSVLRYKRSLKSDSYAGLMGTSVIKSGSSNNVIGADGNIRINKSTILEFHTFVSNTNDTAAGIDNKTGRALGINLHSEKRNLNYALTSKDISEFFVTETGFVERTGITYITGKITPKWYPESQVFRRFDFDFFTGQLRDNIYDKWETSNSFSLVSLIGGSLRSTFKVHYSTEVYQNMKFNTSGIQFVATANIGTKINSTMLYRYRNAVYYNVPEQGYGNSFTGDILYLPFEKLHIQATFTYQDLFRDDDNSKIFDYLITRGRITFQLNKYFFIRAIGEYNNYRDTFTTDFLASFTYIPGTVFHIGYGSLYEHTRWDGSEYIEDTEMMEMKRGFFLKCSYLFRL